MRYYPIKTLSIALLSQFADKGIHRKPEILYPQHEKLLSFPQMRYNPVALISTRLWAQVVWAGVSRFDFLGVVHWPCSSLCIGTLEISKSKFVGFYEFKKGR